MKRHLLIILLLTFSSIYSQTTTKEIKSICYQMNYDVLIKSFNEMQTKSNFSYNIERNNEIIEGYYEQIIKFSNRGNIFKLNLIKKESEIISFNLLSSKQTVVDNVNYKEIAKKDNKELWVALVDLYNETFNYNLTFNIFFTDDILYGDNCNLENYGFSEKTPEYRKKLNKLIEAKDELALINWLKTPKPALQIYAMEGLKFMQEKESISIFELNKIVALLENKDAMVFSCDDSILFENNFNTLYLKIKN